MSKVTVADFRRVQAIQAFVDAAKKAGEFGSAAQGLRRIRDILRKYDENDVDAAYMERMAVLYDRIHELKQEQETIDKDMNELMDEMRADAKERGYDI